MLIIWRGHGYLVPVFCIAGYVFYNLLTDLLNLPDYPAALVSCALTGIALWRVGRRLNDPQRDRVLLDPATNETVRIVDRHDLFWIKVEYWYVAPILVLVWVTFVWLLSLGGR